MHGAFGAFAELVGEGQAEARAGAAEDGSLEIVVGGDFVDPVGAVENVLHRGDREQAARQAAAPGEIGGGERVRLALQAEARTLEAYFELQLVGADRIMMGTDYCFDIAYTEPVKIVEQTPGLDAGQRAMILGGNARRLLRIE